MITRYLDINVCVWCGLSAAVHIIGQGPMALVGVQSSFFFFMSDRGGGTDRLTITATMTTTTSPTHQTYPMRDASASEYDISTFVKKR